GAHRADPTLAHIGAFRASQRRAAVSIVRDPSNPEIGHLNLPPPAGVFAPFQFAFVTEFRPVGNSTSRRTFQTFQYLRAAAPHVNPPPIASRTTRSPRLIRPSLTAVSNASGTEAADVLAWRSTVTTTFSGGRPSFLAVASRIRAFAWCGTTQSTCAAVSPASSSTSFSTSARFTTACGNTSRPFIRSLPTVPVVEGPPSTNSRSLWGPRCGSLVAGG